MGLAYTMLSLDRMRTAEDVGHLAWVFTRDPSGARGLLSVISESVITVAGVVFSVTVVALTMASNQFGTRVLKSFSRDTGNQIVLGTLLGTFLYGIVVMRRVESSHGSSYVPSLSVAFGILLAAVCVGLLVYFIHHVIISIQAENVVASVADDLYDTIDDLFPEELKQPADAHADELSQQETELLQRDSRQLCAERDGFVRSINQQRLKELAQKNAAVIRLRVRPGDFVASETVLAETWGESQNQEDLQRLLRKCFAVGEQRTYEEDVGFGLQQISLVAVRSLSPAINAIGTAQDAIERLVASLVRLGGRKVPSRYVRDEAGRLLVVTAGLDFPNLADSLLDPIRHAAATNPTIVSDMVRRLSWAASNIKQPELRKAMHVHIDRFLAAATLFPQELDRRRLYEMYGHLEN